MSSLTPSNSSLNILTISEHDDKTNPMIPKPPSLLLTSRTPILKEENVLRIVPRPKLNLPNENDMFDTDIEYSYQCFVPLQKVLQTGPNCGLAALAMASSVGPVQLAIEDLYKEALEKGFTKKGEMFSVENLYLLAESKLSNWFTIRHYGGGLLKHQEMIFNALKAGSIILVPYDADKNNTPCCKRGYSAHWAVLCGLLIKKDGSKFVAARQGKSKYVVSWNFLNLHKSNENLFDLNPDNVGQGDYILPDGGVKEGLSGKFIILKLKDQ
uniref:Actin maturation protease n=1 Tax=Clastoptera arizonana TaxID=38151 RepID=A0A1B6CH70_9HEMI